MRIWAVPSNNNDHRRTSLTVIQGAANVARVATAPDIGPTGRVVGANVQRFRRAAGYSLRQMEELLRAAGRPIRATGLLRMEKGERRVDVDELAVLAEVLGVTPTRLLTPDAPDDRLTAIADLSVGGLLDYIEARYSGFGNVTVKATVTADGTVVTWDVEPKAGDDAS